MGFSLVHSIKLMDRGKLRVSAHSCTQVDTNKSLLSSVAVIIDLDDVCSSSQFGGSLNNTSEKVYEGVMNRRHPKPCS